ncbi:arginase family protein [Phytoactinopolyspora limicola]|uniref:arginase family protein n=1 Tax=Phytoactinopolyspora limicola TaxID=2715536 RepID=UPI00140A6268|nr:arginase family protein [Phytoactinopolyspora limicola]
MTRYVVPYHLDEHLPDIEVPLAPDLTISADLSQAGPWQRMAHLHREVAAAVAEDIGSGGLPVVQSGDCMVAIGVVAGAQRAVDAKAGGSSGPTIGVVWFDAHGDVQTLETTTSGYLGGMPLSILTGYRPELLAEPLGLRPVREDHVTLVDARDLDPAEAEYLSRSEVRHCLVDEVGDATVPSGPLVMHIDVDVISPDHLRGLLFPVPGGPSVDAVARAAGRVMATGRVVAVSVGCTWQAGHGAADQIRPHLESLVS